jgi:hypothetical protein
MSAEHQARGPLVGFMVLLWHNSWIFLFTSFFVFSVETMVMQSQLQHMSNTEEMELVSIYCEFDREKQLQDVFILVTKSTTCMLHN